MYLSPSVRIYVRRLPHQSRSFCIISRALAPSFLDLQARAVSRENGHFSKLSGANYIEHSPALQLLRSERDLAERNDDQPTGILLTQPNKDKSALLLEEYKRQLELLRAQATAKEHAWLDRYNKEGKEWEHLEEKTLRFRLMFGVLLVFAGLLALDAIALADEVEEHCPGCFDGNTKQRLYVTSYLKSAAEGLTGWLGRREPAPTFESARQVPCIQTAQPVTLNESKHDVPSSREELTIPDGRAYMTNGNEKYTKWHDPRMSQSAEKATTMSNGSRRTEAELTELNASLWQRLMWARPRPT